MQVSASFEISHREADFVHALAHGQRPTAAAKAAGFSVGHARNLLRRPAIRDALRALSANAAAILRELEAKR